MPKNITGDKDGLIWIGTSDGLNSFDKRTGKFTQYKHIPHDITSVSNEITKSILPDDNVLWISTGGGGLYKFDKTTGTCTHYRHDSNDKNSISGNIVIESYIDSKGNFWVSTEDGGLNKFDKQTGKFTHYGLDCGFPSNSTKHILEDSEGYLWISIGSSIAKFDPSISKVVKIFTKADGLPGNQFDTIANALKDSNGNLWFSSCGGGVCKFNPEEASKIEPNRYIPPIILSSFKSKEETYNENGLKKLTDIKLPWPDNSFEFTFAALDYMNPSKNQYAYRLEGFDKDWNYIGTNRSGKYTNIPPGKYTLYLKGSNNDGVWNEEGISIKIIITPPFWMTWWFRVLVGVTILSIIVGIFQLRASVLEKKAIFMRDSAIAKTAAQVAHDIRSPLAALSMVSKYLSELPEQKRVIIRNAAQRINDIANNLLEKHRGKDKEKKVEANIKEDIKPELVSSLLDSLVSEKRIQMAHKFIELILEVENSAHSIFVRLDAKELKRVISNLINNASEAIHGTRGIIRVTLEKEPKMLTINIIDNGEGISEDILPKIKQGGMSVGKREGCGLRISGAIQNIKNWNGNHDIHSKVGEGTTFIIKLPITEAPDWFQSQLNIKLGMNVIVLDDDQSIHDVWETRFQKQIQNGKIVLEHFYTPSTFIEYCQNLLPANTLFLIDYELLGFEETGLDLIEKLNLREQAILVTSRYEELEIRAKIIKLGIKTIPKNFAPSIPTVYKT